MVEFFTSCHAFLPSLVLLPWLLSLRIAREGESKHEEEVNLEGQEYVVNMKAITSS